MLAQGSFRIVVVFLIVVAVVSSVSYMSFASKSVSESEFKDALKTLEVAKYKLLISDTKLTKCMNELENPDLKKCAKSKEKRVVAFGLYGGDPRYTVGAIHNAELVKYILPGWVVRFYIDNTVPEDIINRLKAEGAEIVKTLDISGASAGMFWRFLVADDPTVDRYIIRDSDSRLSMREKEAIDEWIDSGKGFHILRDHPNHNYPMNGGLWGGTKGALGTTMANLIKQWNSRDNYLADMQFLWTVVYPLIKDNHVAHDSYSCGSHPHTRPFPTRRINKEIVGGVYDENDVPRQGDALLLVPNPVACRKQPHWEFG